MSKILTKPYKRWEAGTALTSDQDEFQRIVSVRTFATKPTGPGVGAVYVNAERMAQLEREGYFDAPLDVSRFDWSRSHLSKLSPNRSALVSNLNWLEGEEARREMVVAERENPEWQHRDPRPYSSPDGATPAPA